MHQLAKKVQKDFFDKLLYDSLSSGAGYAVSMEKSIPQLLKKARELLENCSCDSACYKCLKHYRNQYVHSILGRKTALNLLDWGEQNAKSPVFSKQDQSRLIMTMAQILRLSGIHLGIDDSDIWVKGSFTKKRLVIYPAMWTRPNETGKIFVSDMQIRFAKPSALKMISDSL